MATINADVNAGESTRNGEKTSGDAHDLRDERPTSASNGGKKKTTGAGGRPAPLVRENSSMTSSKRLESGRGLTSPASPVRAEAFDAARLENKRKNKRAARGLTGAIIFCFLFMIAEAAGGFISHSLAVLTDAAHMLTDVAALSLALFSLHASSRPASDSYSYGWQRAEAVGALASVFTIWALVGAIAVNAVERVINDVKCAQDINRAGCEGVDAIVMFGIGCGGLVANIGCACILSWGGHHGHSHGSHGHSHGGGHGHSHGGGDDHGHDHGHSHGHSHGAKKKNGSCNGGGDGGADADESKPLTSEGSKRKAQKNLNIRGAFLHALGDCIQSVGVIIAAGTIWCYNHYMYGSPTNSHSWGDLADPCCSLLFGIITLYTTVGLFKDLLAILMEGTPRDIKFSEVFDALGEINGVDSVHDLHIWSLTAENVVLSVHLVCDPKEGKVLEDAQAVCGRFGIEHTTIQLDPLDATPSSCLTMKFQCAN